MSQPPEVRLLPDEMFSPAIAAELGKLGHDVIAIAERLDLRSRSDEEVFGWASAEQRWLLTENVKDFRPIMLRSLQAGPACLRAACYRPAARPSLGPGRIPAR